MSVSESGLYPMNIGRLVDLLSEAYVALIRSGAPFREFPSTMIWGPPGVGKSQGIRQIGREIERKTGRAVKITDVRLLLFNPVDLRGIPTANAEKTLAVWLKPQIFQMEEDEDVVNILFLDEISAAPPSVQAAAYQIILDRTVGEHRLPENCLIIAAGNRVTDRSVAYNMPRALANRLCHFEIKGDPSEWHDWAIRTGIHPYVTGYLEYNSVALMRAGEDSDLAFPTPRSWEMVSKILQTVPGSIDRLYPLLIGCVGHTTASGFRTWTELYESMPKVEGFLSGRAKDLPKSKELRIALRSVLVDYLRKHPDPETLNRAVDLACRFPWDFRIDLILDGLLIPELRRMVMETDLYQTAKRDGLL